MLDGCILSLECGHCFWTAGQRVDPSTESEFIWRVGLQESAMTYINWYPGEPSYDDIESCMGVWGAYQYSWNDQSCADSLCAVCEIGI